MSLKVSVMVINYNQERYLSAALDSVLGQDYRPIEIVVADDGSTDRSREILNRYAAEYPGQIVLCFREKNGGITPNRNTAFSACTGDLIAYLDGDDLFNPGKIAAQVRLFESDPKIVLSYHAAEIFDSSTNKSIFVTNQSPRERIYDVCDIITKMGVPHTSSIMVRRAACPPTGFEEALPHVSDWLFEIEVSMNGRVVGLDEVYSRYRKHDNNSTVNLGKFLHEFEKTLDLVENRYGSDLRIKDACRRGRARFLAGEAFRNLATNPSVAQELLLKARRLAPEDLRYRLAYLVSKTSLSRHVAVRSKNWLKRNVG